MDTKRFIVRPFEEGDFTRDNPITVEAWRGIFDSWRELLGDELFEYFYDGWEERKYAEFGNGMRRNAEKGMAFTIVDTDDGSIAAMGSHTISGNFGVIVSNAVRPDLRGLGLGSGLHRVLLDSMRSHGLKYAQVGTGLDKGHDGARRAYERAGFDRSSPDITYFRNNENAPAASGFELPEGMVIRRPSDAAERETIAALAVEAWRPVWDTARINLGDEIFAAQGDLKAAKYSSTLNMLSQDDYFGYGLYIGGQLAGFCSWYISDAPGGKCGVVGLNGVSNAFKGRRLGLVMQNYIVKDMLENDVKYSKVLTGLDDGHAPARKTYERSGFDKSIPSIRYYRKL